MTCLLGSGESTQDLENSPSDEDNMHKDKQISSQCQDHQEQSENMEIHLLCYNVFMRPFVHTNRGGDFKSERLSALLKDERFLKCGIVALQEMFALGSNRTRLMIDYCARNLELKHHVSIASEFFRGKPIDSGLFILSKYPIVEKDYIVFTKGKDIDGWCTKGVLSALIEIPVSPNLSDAKRSCKVLVMTTHTQAEYDEKNPIYFSIQKSQLLEMRRFLDKKKKEYPNVPMILMGDFNINARLFDQSPEDILARESSSATYDTMMCMLSWRTTEQELASIVGDQQVPSALKYKVEEDSSKGNIEVEQLEKEKEERKDNDWKDLVREFQGKHPVTFADGKWNDESKRWETLETCLTHPLMYSARQRLDYIFYYNPVENSPFGLKPISAQIEPFFVPGHRFTQLSDHYAVTCTLQVSQQEPIDEKASDNTPTNHEQVLVECNASSADVEEREIEQS